MLISALALWAALSAQASDALEPLRVELGLNGRFTQGEALVVRVRPPDYGYLAVLHVDPAGRAGLLFPRNPGGDHAVRGRKTYELWPPTGDQAFTVRAAGGQGVVLAVFSASPLNLAALSAEGRWDRGIFATLEEGRSPERYLQRVAATLAGGQRFEVATANYEVVSPNVRTTPEGATVAGDGRMQIESPPGMPLDRLRDLGIGGPPGCREEERGCRVTAARFGDDNSARTRWLMEREHRDYDRRVQAVLQSARPADPTPAPSPSPPPPSPRDQ